MADELHGTEASAFPLSSCGGETGMTSPRREWSKPTIVEKPVEETLNGTGTTPDGGPELQS